MNGPVLAIDNYFMRILSLVALFLSACAGSDSGSVTANSGSLQGIPIPFAASVSTSNQGTLSAYITIDSGQRQKMDITGDTASLKLIGIPAGPHSITIEFEYVVKGYPDKPLILASANKALDISSGKDTALQYSSSDYDINGHDADGDKKSNLSELTNHTNPFSSVDVSTAAFEKASDTVKESVGGVGLNIVLDQAAAYDVSLSYSVSGTATGGGVDHSLTDGTFVIPAGQVSASLDFTVVDDTAVEGDETVVVTLNSATDGLVGTQNAETVTIKDNDATLGGTVTGLANNAVLTLQDNGGDAIQITGNGADQQFTFPTPIDNSIGYQVTSILPFSANEICGVAYGKGGAVSADVTDVTVSCVPNTGKKIAGGYSYHLDILSDGTLWAWGNNFNGELGDGTHVERHAPVQIGTDNHWASVAAGDHSVAIKTDGTLWTWGYNFYGQLGDGTTNSRSTPMQVGNATDWISIAAGAGHTVTLRKNGTNVTLWAWGDNNHGQLGDGNSLATKPDPSVHVPKQIEKGISDWVSISAGDYFSTALRSDGTYTTLWTWGKNAYGQLGDGTYNDSSTPKQVGNATDHWVSISANRDHVVALKSDGVNVTLWAWGNNESGQIGDGTDPLIVSSVAVPEQIGSRTDWIRAESGDLSSAAIALGSNGIDKTLWVWGDNSAGQLGNGDTSIPYSNVPQQVGTYTGWKEIAPLRGYSIIGRHDDGTLWAWGSNGNGLIGDGTVTDKSSPVQIGTSTSFLYHTIGGTVSGLASGNTLTLQNDDNSGSPVTLDVTADGPFVFLKGYIANTPYTVSVVSNTPVSQTCNLSKNSGTDVGANVNDVSISCK